MRILITNDDGIMAPGLQVLHDLAIQLAGPEGEVWTVAPQSEQSGVGHCISYTKPVLVHQYAARKFAVEGSPADCILAGLNDLLPQRPDLVLSGVNKGNNSAENTVYSGTIGAAMEAALAGVPSIALSQFYGPQNTDLDNSFEASAGHGVAAIQACLDAGFARAETAAARTVRAARCLSRRQVPLARVARVLLAALGCSARRGLRRTGESENLR